MLQTSEEVISYLVAKSTCVLTISEIGGREWYRKPKDGRRGPWLSAKYSVINEAAWRRRSPCIYFVRDNTAALRYVGISLNRVGDRWRTSPAYTEDDVLLPGEELFHSQCWPKICENARNGTVSSYEISVLSGIQLLELLRTINHDLVHLSFLRNDPEIIVTVLELWICKYGYTTLWNKALTGGKNERVSAIFAESISPRGK